MTMNLLLKRTDPVWLAEVEDWVIASLAMRSIAIIGPAAEVRVLPWSAVFRFPTHQGDVYFKACAPSQAFEPALMRYLAERRPDDVLPVLAADLNRAWLLMPDGGSVLRYVLTGDAADLVAHWSAILPQLAALQIDLTADVGRLLALGVPDRRPAALPGLLQALLDDTDRWPLDHSEGLTRDDLPRLRAFTPQLASHCEELAALGPATSLVHEEIHDGHVFVQQGSSGPCYRFFDFGDACVTHPFLQLIAAQRFYPRAFDDIELNDETVEALYETYISGWAHETPPAARRRALQLALAVGPLTRALTWVAALGPYYPDLEPDLLSMYARSVAHWLRETENRCGRLS